MLRLYVCGPTVYDAPHIGNLRPLLTYDLVTRAYSFLERPFTYVHNITDIDDKIIDRARLLGISEQALATKYAREYNQLLKLYHVRKPTHMPLVTAHLPQLIALITRLIATKFAYVTPEGVYFDVARSKTYGIVSNQKLSAMQFDEAKSTFKRHQADFALWKLGTSGITYASPWGNGRPGWHTECVTFIDYYFAGQRLDVHGGGIDLIFPHHENENAQFAALHGHAITKRWGRSGQIYWGEAKMSKSLGNVISAQDFARDYGPDTLRLSIFNASLTSPLHFDEAQLSQTAALVAKYRLTYRRAQLLAPRLPRQTAQSKAMAKHLSNLDFAQARLILQTLIKDFNHYPDLARAKNVILALNLLGFKFTQVILSTTDHLLYNQWVDLKAKGDYKRADAVRIKLQQRFLL